MLHDGIDDPESATVEDALGEYEAALAAALDEAGGGDADEETITAVRENSIAELTLEDAASVLGASDGWPPIDAIAIELRDDLLLGMSSAVLDVEALSARADVDLSPREVQQKVEGRAPMTLAEFAALRLTIDRRRR